MLIIPILRYVLLFYTAQVNSCLTPPLNQLAKLMYSTKHLGVQLDLRTYTVIIMEEENNIIYHSHLIDTCMGMGKFFTCCSLSPGPTAETTKLSLRMMKALFTDLWYFLPLVEGSVCVLFPSKAGQQPEAH